MPHQRNALRGRQLCERAPATGSIRAARSARQQPPPAIPSAFSFAPIMARHKLEHR